MCLVLNKQVINQYIRLLTIYNFYNHYYYYNLLAPIPNVIANKPEPEWDTRLIVSGIADPQNKKIKRVRCNKHDYLLYA